MARIVEPDPCPRFIRDSDRAPEGRVRVKLRMDGVTSASSYVLARTEGEARAFYLASRDMHAHFQPDDVRLTSTLLPD